MDGGWWDRLRRVDPRIWDALLALGVVVAGALAFALRMHRPDEPPEAVGFALVVVAGASLAWRRRAPLTVATIVSAVVATASLLGYWPEFVLMLWIAVYSAAAYTERDRLIRVLLPVAVLTATAISVGERWDRGLNWVEILADLVLSFGVPFLLGRMTFYRRRRIVREREIATRELHDVVAHHMSVMVVQAGAAWAVSGSDPAATAEALRQIEASGRTGLTEMRRLLEVLKAGGDGDGRAPQPSRVRRGHSRPASTCRRTESCRRRSPTRSGTPAGRAPGSSYATGRTRSSSRSPTMAPDRPRTRTPPAGTG